VENVPTSWRRRRLLLLPSGEVVDVEAARHRAARATEWPAERAGGGPPAGRAPAPLPGLARPVGRVALFATRAQDQVKQPTAAASEQQSRDVVHGATSLPYRFYLTI
jgi:hypothetical protein